MVLFSSFNHLNVFLLFLYLGLISGFIFFIVFNITKYLKQRNNNFIKQNKQKKINKSKSLKNISTNNQTIVEKIKEEKSEHVNNLTVFKKQDKNLIERKLSKSKNIIKEKNNSENTQTHETKERLKSEKIKLKQQKKLLKQNKKAQKKAQKNIKRQKLKQALKIIWQKVKLLLKRAQNVLLTIVCIITLVGVVLGSYYINFILNYGHLRVVFVVVWIFAFMLGGFVQKKVAKFLSNFYNKFSKQTKNSN